jgi:hypothetical protein
MDEYRTPLPIENCRRWFKFLCPKTWSQLERTEQLDMCFCPACRKNVYCCDCQQAIEEHRRAGHCICIESGMRQTDFIGEPCPDEGGR